MRTRLISFVVAVFLAAPLAAQRPIPNTREQARVPYSSGLESFKTEAWDDAVKSFKSAIDIDPTFEMAFYMLGRTHMAQKKFAEAVATYEKCRTLHQQQSGRQYTNAQERQRALDTRLREIDEVIRTYQGTQQTQNVINALRQLENQKRMTQEEISRRNSTMTLGLSVPAYVSMALGSAYFRMGNLASAEKEYKAAVEADGRSGEAYNNLAVVYMETGRLDDAEKSVRAAEQVGFKVQPQLKDEIKNRRKAGTL